MQKNERSQLLYNDAIAFEENQLHLGCNQSEESICLHTESF